MTKESEKAHLAAHKLRLAEKYESRAKASNSQPRRVVWLRLAKKYRRQATGYSPAS